MYVVGAGPSNIGAHRLHTEDRSVATSQVSPPARILNRGIFPCIFVPGEIV